MKRHHYFAALVVAVCLVALIFWIVIDDNTQEPPPGEYGYRTHGTGNPGDPYWCNIISFDSSEEFVTIQSALEGYPMTEISANSFGKCKGMTDLILPAALERIGAGAFSKCETLERIYFLGGAAISIDSLPNNIEIYVLPLIEDAPVKWNILPLHTYGGEGCFLTYYVLNGEATIHSLISGKNVVIPSTLPADGTNVPVTAIGNEAFRNSSIRSIDIPDTVTVIGVRAFYGCHELEHAVLPSSLKKVCDEAFRECHVLNNVDLHQAEYIGFESFRMCYGFTEVIIPDSVMVMKEGAFRVCTQVVSLTIGSGITEIPDSAFDYYWSLENLEIRGKVTRVGHNAFFSPTNFMPKLERISLPYVETIGSSAFSGCINLKEVIVGDNLREIGSYAFRDCRSLSSLRLPASLEKVGDSAFYNARSLEDIYFEGKMPSFGNDVFAGIDVTVHCTAKYKNLWKGFEGNLIVDPA